MKHRTAARRLTQALCPAMASRLLDDISKARLADRGPMAATKDPRRAVRAALCAQRSEYGPLTGRRDR